VDRLTDAVIGKGEAWPHAEDGGWAATMTGEFRVEERKTGPGERSQTSGTDLFVPAWSLRCRVSSGVPALPHVAMELVLAGRQAP
jgi:hypothetical protein